MKRIRYQTLLLQIFLFFNHDEFQNQDPALFSRNFNISMEIGTVQFFEFTNKLMSRIYQMIFDTELPRVFEDMKNKL